MLIADGLGDLPPMPLDKYLSPGTLNPTRRHRAGVQPRWPHPGTRNPNVRTTVPPLVARGPHIAADRARLNGARTAAGAAPCERKHRPTSHEPHHKKNEPSKCHRQCESAQSTRTHVISPQTNLARSSKLTGFVAKPTRKIGSLTLLLLALVSCGSSHGRTFPTPLGASATIAMALA
jgi:hypothetical protein